MAIVGMRYNGQVLVQPSYHAPYANFMHLNEKTMYAYTHRICMPKMKLRGILVGAEFKTGSGGEPGSRVDQR